MNIKNNLKNKIAEVGVKDPEKTSVDGFNLIGYDPNRRTRFWIVQKAAGKKYHESNLFVAMRWKSSKDLTASTI